MTTPAKPSTELKFTVIYDNRTCDNNLQEGFGFSCLIEWNNKKILFDTGGNRDAFFANIEKQKISLDSISDVFFSHKHWDHTTAFNEILNKLQGKTTIHIPEPFNLPLEKQIPSKLELKKNKCFEQISPNIYSLTLKGKLYCGLSSLHEQSLIFDTPQGLVILTGCAHAGIINIIEATKEKLPDKKIHLVMGGFHLHHSWSYTISKVVKQVQELNVEKVAPCHCAGDTAISQFQKAFGENYIKIGTGSVLVI